MSVTIMYHPEPDTPITVEDINSNTKVTYLRYGDLQIFPKRGQLWQLRAAIDAYLQLKAVDRAT